VRQARPAAPGGSGRASSRRAATWLHDPEDLRGAILDLVAKDHKARVIGSGRTLRHSRLCSDRCNPRGLLSLHDLRKQWSEVRRKMPIQEAPPC
jgi:hypothetical protein